MLEEVAVFSPAALVAAFQMLPCKRSCKRSDLRKSRSWQVSKNWDTFRWRTCGFSETRSQIRNHVLLRQEIYSSCCYLAPWRQRRRKSQQMLFNTSCRRRWRFRCNVIYGSTCFRLLYCFIIHRGTMTFS